MIVDGDTLTSLEQQLVRMGDVTDANELRDIELLRYRQGQVHILGRYRIERQIAALLNSRQLTAEVINRAQRR